MARIFTFLSGLLLCCVIVSGSGYAAIKTVDVFAGNRLISQKGIINKGSLYVPVRGLSEALGVSCKWEPSRNRLVVNGKTVFGKAIKYRDALYIPYSSFASCSGIAVVYDGKASRVVFNPSVGEHNTVSFFENKGSAFPILTSSPSSSGYKSSASGSSKVSSFIDEPFIPVMGENDIFKVAVTNIKDTSEVKGQSVSNPDNKFVIVHLSQQNVSNEVQIYTGKFALMDKSSRIYEYSEGLSNFWLIVLRPGGSNFGYIVFEIPKTAEPSKLILSTTSRPPLALNLH